MKQLTKAEEQVMHILWKLKEGVVREVISHFNDPKPAYTTVATVLKVLEKKKFVSHKAYGNTYVYFPSVTKKAYANFQFSNLLKNYFNGSFPRLATFFARENNLSMEELEVMIKMAEEELKNKE